MFLVFGCWFLVFGGGPLGGGQWSVLLVVIGSLGKDPVRSQVAEHQKPKTKNQKPPPDNEQRTTRAKRAHRFTGAAAISF
jgi:hypothetical protein